MFPIGKRFTSKVAAEWFRASEAAGDFMGIRYGCVVQGSSEVKWHFVSHIDCDGIGGFARLLRERGLQIGKLPETKHPCSSIIAPLWNLWRTSRNEANCAERADWMKCADHDPTISEAVAWYLFSKEETVEMMTRCRVMGVTINSFLLKQLDHAVRHEIAQPQARIRWLIPVNLRGDCHDDDDTANHVSCVEVGVAPDEGVEDIQVEILRRLKCGEHRANHLLFMAGGLLSHQRKIGFLKHERAKPRGNIGSFSNLGVWNINDATSEGWVFCPPVVAGQLLGAGCVTFQGRLGVAIQSHSTAPATVEGWLKRWLDLIRIHL
jgi:hypothetical protein